MVNTINSIGRVEKIKKVYENIILSLQQQQPGDTSSSSSLEPITLSQGSIECIHSMKSDVNQRLMFKAHELIVSLLLSGDLARNAVVNGMAAVVKPQDLLFKSKWSKKDMKESMLFDSDPFNCSIYLAGIMEYIVTRLLELSLKIAQQDNNKSMIEPEHIRRAISKDSDLEHLFHGSTISAETITFNFSELTIVAKENISINQITIVNDDQQYTLKDQIVDLKDGE
ncbi:hypothetical protein DFA_09042 [Cavenderia fasciculata]|uniref:Histone H2A n=1 Tax=Cavenderia fasciculata TaxID=261658 RepID=F4Q6J4_CACFS|nr:uncharacterized protein DFA_09042 [Cavenderia fasciculata]EGG16504.1 hypothetical protein DFA_09042 [Cavenderia fasciculata]|eukprot:XP_004354904.1 hypothetical protein DFA_09042 [Cavenderia fasciculata]